jgi:hypothetical protein
VKLTPRRTIAAAAIAGAAVLLPAIALASSGSPGGARTIAHTASARAGAGAGHTGTARIGRCRRSQLVAWLGIPRTGFSNESNFYDLEMSNISDRACTLYGYPGVSAETQTGSQLGRAARRDGGFLSLVTLAPGGTAHATLFIDYKGDYPASQCGPKLASGLRVYAPGDFSSMEFAFSFWGCARPGPSYLAVSTTVAGTGIPGDNGAAAQPGAEVTRCHTGQLAEWIGIPAVWAAGSTYYQLELSNISGRACTLYGYPGVSALRGRKQLGAAASRDRAHPATLVTLTAGATAHVILRITDVGVFPPNACSPTRATSVQVFAPGAYSSRTIPIAFSACSRRGPVYLHVSTTIAGTGIPGYSS